MSDCLFCRIASGAIPAQKVYEDDELLAFHDINPVAPVHVLIAPKQHITSLLDIQAQDTPLLGRLLAAAPRIAKELGLNEGFRTMINTGAAHGQSVFHLHLHVFGGHSDTRPINEAMTH